MPRLAGIARTASLCAAAALIAGFAGCGGGSSSPSANFTDRADSICRQTEQQFQRIQVTPPGTAGEAEKQASALADVSQQALGDLKALTPPDSLDAAYQRYLDSRQQALDELKAAEKAAADNDAAAYAKAKRRVSAQQATRLELARKVGLKECSLPAVSVSGKGK